MSDKSNANHSYPIVVNQCLDIPLNVSKNIKFNNDLQTGVELSHKSFNFVGASEVAVALKLSCTVSELTV